MDIESALYSVKNAIKCVKEIQQELKSTGTQDIPEKDVYSLQSPILNDLGALQDELYYGFMEDISNYPAEDLEEWKDMVTQCLPEGASAGMANDVITALDSIKSVY